MQLTALELQRASVTRTAMTSILTVTLRATERASRYTGNAHRPVKLAMLFHRNATLTAMSNVLATMLSRLKWLHSRSRYARVAPPNTIPLLTGSLHRRIFSTARNSRYRYQRSTSQTMPHRHRNPTGPGHARKAESEYHPA